MISIKIGNSFDLIKELPNNYIDCVVTSPPYWGLRDYKTEPIIFDGNPKCQHEWNSSGLIGQSTAPTKWKKADIVFKQQEGYFCSLCGAWRGQLGLEPTPEFYIKHMLDFFDNVKLKLKDEGNCFVNLGDTFFASGGAGGDYNDGGLKEGQPKYKQGNNKHPFLKPKSLCMIPSRFAWGMIERGWILRNEIIWSKPNHMPESVTDRLTKAHEVVYHFVKQGRYYYNLDVIRKPLANSSIERISQKTVFDQIGGLKQELLRGNPDSGNASRCNKMVQSLAKKYKGKFEDCENPESFGRPMARTQRTKFDEEGNKNASSLTNSRDYYRNNGLVEGHPNGKNPGDVWSISTQPYNEAHFATFPLELVRRPILSGCPPDGLVLDPFAGSGTIGEFCRKNNRNALLFELNPEYKKLIEDRSLSNIIDLSEL